ncbi:MAG TPA: hypothetical protein VFS05_09740 [Gemmatimonadaceae bacterium]|nr:hypothetical protein [Gemmatimonadaceae bacterium]
MTAVPAERTAPATRASSGSGRAAAVIAWGVLAAMLAAALACIALYGRDIPMAEDWLLVPPLTGHEPDLGAWLWAQNNEHRVPLPKLLYLGLLKASGGDFRSGMVFNALALAAMAAAMMLAARRIRGRTSAADAFFPIAMLELGDWMNIVWSWQIQFVVSAALVIALLVVIVRQRGTLSPRAAVAAALAMALLPFTGASGLIFAAALAPWALYTAWLHLRGGGATGPRWPGALIAAATVAAGLTGLLYFVGYERPTWNPPSPSHLATLKTAAKFLALGFGPAAIVSWTLFVLAAAAVLAPAAALVVMAALRAREGERARAWGLLLFTGGMAVMALGIGYGRAAQVPTIGLPTRYVLFALPAYCAAFFIYLLYAPPLLARAAQWALLASAVLLLPFNTRQGFYVRDWYLGETAAVERDIAAGLSPEALAARNRAFLMHWNERQLAERIRMLREAGIGPFARWGETPAR